MKVQTRAYSPLPQLSESDYERMVEEVVEPTINGLRKAEFNYIGLIYIGMILTGQGPKVIEYNVRLGDPETQVVLPRIDSDFAELVDAAINGKPLPEVKLRAIRNLLSKAINCLSLKNQAIFQSIMQTLRANFQTLPQMEDVC